MNNTNQAGKGPILELRNLSIALRTGNAGVLNIVENISFSLHQGHTLGVVGESGCGKSILASSLLKLAPNGTEERLSGQVLLDGHDLVPVGEKAMRQIRGHKMAMIFQEPMTALNPAYRIETQMREALRAHKRIGYRESQRLIVELLNQVGIPQSRTVARQFPHQLSGGMRQRVMIAMAISCMPELLIADEPTTALDVTIQAQILALMKDIKEKLKAAIIFISHDMGVIREIADYVMVMYAGELVEYSPCDEIFSRPLHPYTSALLKSIPRSKNNADELYTIRDTVPQIGAMPRGCRFSPRCDCALPRCHEEKPSEIFEGEHRVRCWKYGNI
ncbi:MAG: ABC transporter ATP-binding protein [Treponema sp.]|jgi:oligopeptide/dipeptide ABC transporter ATP-binding protein|nr:ABC transporter ATP-binding protein [Treponema sp.]